MGVDAPGASILDSRVTASRFGRSRRLDEPRIAPMRHATRVLVIGTVLPFTVACGGAGLREIQKETPWIPGPWMVAFGEPLPQRSQITWPATELEK